eukprot:TRINITY_DN382_c0_g1_i1.p2 TRINITY_DN382_c0_g1~~TRINITY_DN382_c0_g1_i1.p2  ORF type:complete len:126 (+),score=4.67 TRINITY_DN382_c0_g1_i1:989-1366(+)
MGSGRNRFTTRRVDAIGTWLSAWPLEGREVQQTPSLHVGPLPAAAVCPDTICRGGFNNTVTDLANLDSEFFIHCLIHFFKEQYSSLQLMVLLFQTLNSDELAIDSCTQLLAPSILYSLLRNFTRS